MAAVLVSQTSPVVFELFSYANASFVPINLLRCENVLYCETKYDSYSLRGLLLPGSFI